MRANDSLRIDSETRAGVGNGSGGGVNFGWKPPTLSTNSGWSPQAISSPISPPIVMNSTRLPNSEAKNQSRLLSTSSAPMNFTCSTSSAASSSGRTHLSTPRMAMLPGGTSMMTPSDARDQRRRAPAELRHRPDQERALLGGKEAPHVGDDPRRVGDDVLREHDALDRAGAHALGQLLEHHRPVEAEQPADADQREAEAELDAACRTRR